MLEGKGIDFKKQHSHKQNTSEEFKGYVRQGIFAYWRLQFFFLKKHSIWSLHNTMLTNTLQAYVTFNDELK